MPDRRGREHHFERLADALREEIGVLLEGELADPRIGLASVSEVQLAPDGRSALVMVVVPGDEQQAQESMKGLMSARTFIRREVGERLHLRHAPELFFQLDRSEEYQSRIEKLLARTRKKKRSSG